MMSLQITVTRDMLKYYCDELCMYFSIVVSGNLISRIPFCKCSSYVEYLKRHGSILEKFFV